MREGTVIVTGASRGIGAAIAADLAGRGFSVAALSRSGAAPAGAGYACDVTDEAALAATIAAVAARAPIVGLVNNAGQQREAPSATLATADYEALMRLNATSVFMASRMVYPHLVAAGGGLIVNMGSFLDKIAAVRNLAYSASKAAIGAMTRTLAVEWAADGIRVLNIAPGYVATDLNRSFLENEKIQAWIGRRVPLKRTAEPAEIARLVGALMAEDIGFLTGETIYIDGGQGVML